MVGRTAPGRSESVRQAPAQGGPTIILTVTAWVGYFVWRLLKDLLSQHYSTSVDRAEPIIYLLIVSLLTASSLA